MRCMRKANAIRREGKRLQMQEVPHKVRKRRICVGGKADTRRVVWRGSFLKETPFQTTRVVIFDLFWAPHGTDKCRVS